MLEYSPYSIFDIFIFHCGQDFEDLDKSNPLLWFKWTAPKKYFLWHFEKKKMSKYQEWNECRKNKYLVFKYTFKSNLERKRFHSAATGHDAEKSTQIGQKKVQIYRKKVQKSTLQAIASA